VPNWPRVDNFLDIMEICPQIIQLADDLAAKLSISFNCIKLYNVSAKYFRMSHENQFDFAIVFQIF